MADDADRSEKPTPRRRSEARREGQVPVSKEVTTLANLLVVTLMLLVVGRIALEQSVRLFHFAWAPRDDFNLQIATDLLRMSFGAAMPVLLPIFFAVVVAAVLSTFAMTKANVSRKKLKPKLGNMNPVKNVSRIFKQSGPIELVKSVLKLLFVGGAIWWAIHTYLQEYLGLMFVPLLDIVGFQLGMVIFAFLIGCVAMVIVAALDFSWQYYQSEKAMRMTKTEVKEERRQVEGDPLVKRHILSKAYERLRTRMMAAVPKADVVVTNPEHFAVALEYDRADMPAPKVVAKGRGFLALRIRELARQSGVPIVVNPPLARSLYRSVKVGQIIPEKTYQAVAELLAYVYRLDRQKARAW